MSSVPADILRDVLLPLGRWTLDDVQFTSRRFRRLIFEHMSNVCLREIDRATFHVPTENTSYARSWYVIHVNSRPEQQVANTHKESAHLFPEFVHALRSCRVAVLTIRRKSANDFLGSTSEYASSGNGMAYHQKFLID